MNDQTPIDRKSLTTAQRLAEYAAAKEIHGEFATLNFPNGVQK